MPLFKAHNNYHRTIYLSNSDIAVCAVDYATTSYTPVVVVRHSLYLVLRLPLHRHTRQGLAIAECVRTNTCHGSRNPDSLEHVAILKHRSPQCCHWNWYRYRSKGLTHSERRVSNRSNRVGHRHLSKRTATIKRMTPNARHCPTNVH